MLVARFCLYFTKLVTLIKKNWRCTNTKYFPQKCDRSKYKGQWIWYGNVLLLYFLSHSLLKIVAGASGFLKVEQYAFIHILYNDDFVLAASVQ